VLEITVHVHILGFHVIQILPLEDKWKLLQESQFGGTQLVILETFELFTLVSA